MPERVMVEFTTDGTGHCLYHELIELQKLGPLVCERASCVEFNPRLQQWEVSRAGQELVLFRSSSRCACLKWELEHLAPVQQ